MINSLLIANRGEIACRIIRTARRMGIRTVAIYSDADLDAPHVMQADKAVRIGPAPAVDSYLNIENILEAAKTLRVEAIHPGYGFLSENAEFAQRCHDAGILFVGPSAKAIAAMGSKSAAKTLMAAADVAVVPGYHGDAQDIETLTREANRCGFPLLLKASAGGGGKGMRVVERIEELQASVDAVKRESLAAFGDDHLLLERYLSEPRHIEIQVFGDSFGNYVHLFERDCSVQRRHQKIIEEAPAPGLTEAQRSSMGIAAVNAAKAINYCGAGTVEFIVEGNQFYFMEMNTRLQVEHPVTEMITGYDLVEWQLQVAAGKSLPASQKAISLTGHSIEVRLYAEDADNHFLPASGVIEHLCFPVQSATTRVDSGIVSGNEVSIYYDPMLAKLIAHGDTRDDALTTLLHMLDDTQILGVSNNLDYLYRIANSQPFRDAELTTSFVETHRQLLSGSSTDSSVHLAAGAAFLAQQGSCTVDFSCTDSPWQKSDGWRLNSPHLFGCYLQHDSAVHFVKVAQTQSGFKIETDESSVELTNLVVHSRFNEISFIHENTSYNAQVLTSENFLGVKIGSQQVVFTRYLETPVVSDTHEHESGLNAPMPGKILRVMVNKGDQVKQDDPLVIVEAMKMEHTVRAPRDGKIGEIFFKEGESVEANALLLSLD